MNQLNFPTGLIILPISNEKKKKNDKIEFDINFEMKILHFIQGFENDKKKKKKTMKVYKLK